ncbi:MAG: DUF2304 domain-containing protein [Nitrospiraceae bacterium]|nr:DUF2304 domain-containing protein [Nitrospiraceae bacterium]
MSPGMRIMLFVFGIILSGIIFELVRRKRFREELSIAWFAVSIILMASSVADKVIDPFAKHLGISYPPALVFVWIIFCLVLALIYFSSVISDLKGKIKELGQKIALMESDIDTDRSAGQDNKDGDT